MLDPDYLRALDMGEARTVIAERDAMLYALSIGLGDDPTDPFDLRYTYERDLAVFPTMALVVMAAPGWLGDPRTGISWNHVVHGAEHLVIHQDLPLHRPITARLHVAEIFDREDKGALLVLERRLSDADGAPLATIRQQVLCRADGGFGGARGGVPRRPVPDRAPDRVVEVALPRFAALFYRLNQDRNPLHVDPAYAGAAGFPRPIMHGLGTFGFAVAAILRAIGGGRVTEAGVRFAGPVYPGETLALSVWEEPGCMAFRGVVEARGAVGLDDGFVCLA
ncbi:MaoC/PaaZ C-terminal domain-containing protein [Novosphingobium sp. BL-52-GroH]|uniref:MaoC/PaaZ C-terminal domain-containing protein n=1 Tax=Novosphingobium sp. BL-52-GroH TaxID=3349877 RepID=UPI00384B6AA0